MSRISLTPRLLAVGTLGLTLASVVSAQAREDVSSRELSRAASDRSVFSGDAPPRSPAAPEVSAFDAKHAIAILHPTQGNEARGIVEFRQTEDGVEVSARVEGLAPGRHGYHVHLYGDCSSPDAESAGTHFNFLGSSEDPPEDIDRITGNLGELEAKGDAPASARRTLEHAALEGPYSIVGHSVVVHERGNDPGSPPIGDAGGRVACGVIGFADGNQKG